LRFAVFGRELLEIDMGMWCVRFHSSTT
jgi:hypothetical protein